MPGKSFAHLFPSPAKPALLAAIQRSKIQNPALFDGDASKIEFCIEARRPQTGPVILGRNRKNLAIVGIFRE
jgi:hypothetical protein